MTPKNISDARLMIQDYLQGVIMEMMLEEGAEATDEDYDAGEEAASLLLEIFGLEPIEIREDGEIICSITLPDPE